MKKLLLFILICQGLILQANGFLAPNLCEELNSNTSEISILESNVNVIVIPLDNAQPGFDSSYQIVYENLGRTNIDGEIELNFDISKLEYLASTPFVESLIGNSMRWSYADLAPSERRFITIDFSVFQPPVVEDGDILNFYATVSPFTGDEDVTDNVFELSQSVVNSFDPNDKRILEGEEITIDKVGDFLHFIVRFQNTGTAPATNVRVRDDLEEKLDWSSFVMISASHQYEIVINENSIEFVFNGINLPTEEEDREGSKGFVVFKVKPLIGTISIGDVIRNRAGIYFDFNPPIITNTAEITYVENLSISDKNELNVQYYPNPVRNQLFLKAKDEITNIEIFDELGRKLQTLSPLMNAHLLDVSNLNSGQYFIKVTSNNNFKVLKVIKL
ncbi:MAG: T9SS type A sorting domain-containing protein [Flavobacteriaceae bacterium]|nr:T9SS type A sorting domain-containing protein [Flavobacteriaceae bacterium]